jgi:AraC-like DNA-binding protein
MSRLIEPSILKSLYKPLLGLVQSYGVSEEDLFGRGGQSPRTSKIQTRPHSNIWLDLMERAVVLTGDPAAILRFGQTIRIDDIGPLGFALMSSANIESVLRLLIRYHPIISLDLRWQLVDIPNGAALRIEVTTGTAAQRILFIESVLSSVKWLGDFLLDGGLTELELHLDYSPPEYAESYKKLFGPRVVFNAEYCQLNIPSEILCLPLSSANAEAQVVVAQQCELIIEHLAGRGNLSTKVRWLLVQTCSNPPDIEKVAGKLFMSERNLRRKLKLEGYTFRQLQDEVRNALATEYLRSTEFSASDIAMLLGYTERANFNRAFIRWNNVTPSLYREQVNKKNNGDAFI